MSDANLSTKQFLALSAILAGQRPDAVAQACGVSRRQVDRWMSSDVFTAELARCRAQISNALSMRVMDHAANALETLADLSKNSERDADRIRAAGLLLGHALGVVGDAEREARIAAIALQVERLQRQRDG